MIGVTFNGATVSVESIEQFATELDAFDAQAQFELWLSSEKGPSICMLRNGVEAFLMYLRFEGDSGYVSKGSSDASAYVKYRLSNGQEDEYPASWSLPLEKCYQAMAYFYVNDGLLPDWVEWSEP